MLAPDIAADQIAQRKDGRVGDAVVGAGAPAFALDQALLQHGAPARPVKEQPVLWMKNPRLQKS